MQCSFCMGIEPSDGIRKENTVFVKFVTEKSPSRMTSIPFCLGYRDSTCYGIDQPVV